MGSGKRQALMRNPVYKELRSAKHLSHQIAGTIERVFGPDQVLEVRNVAARCMLQGSGAGRTNGTLRSSLTTPYRPGVGQRALSD